MESADSMASMDKASRNKVSAAGEENVLNIDGKILLKSTKQVLFVV
ncbi:Uncharacterised protein [Enterocloster clostridioformis]|uniref:Uncharacterized protein n=1 Tax=Enterocloster clostridioformis TaxID=1531 RepID=A0A2X2UDD7_9FIRM|nr:Uncharacterised protein [Enterocloster clostridioformis]